MEPPALRNDSRTSPIPHRRWIPWLWGGMLLVAGVLAIVFGTRAEAFVGQWERARPGWMVAALALQLVTYAAQGRLISRVAMVGGMRLGFGTSIRLVLFKQFVDQTVPLARLGGTFALTRELDRRGMPRPLIATEVVVETVSYALASVAVIATALPLLSSGGVATATLVVISLLFVTASLGATGLLLRVAGHHHPVRDRPSTRLRSVQKIVDFLGEADPGLVRSPRLVAETVAYKVLIFLCDAATLWSLLRALGSTPSPAGVYAGFVGSSLLRTLNVVPGGLGVFELASTATLTLAGVSVSSALSATLLFRLLTFWLPMLPGLWISRRLLSRPTERHEDRTIPIALRNAPLPALFERLGSRREGLSGTEARERLERPQDRRRTVSHRARRWMEFARTAVNPLVVILLLAAAASAFLGELADAVIIVAMVGLNAVVNIWQTTHSNRAVEGLRSQVAPTATVLRDGAWTEVPRDAVVEGDVVRLSAGDLIPGDARLIEARDLHVQQSALTGESFPAEKIAIEGASGGAAGPDAPHLLFLGTSVVSGTAQAVVFATGAGTAFGDILERLSARPEETAFERGVRRFGMLILQTTFFLVLLVLVVNIGLGRDPLASLLFAVALAVGLTPEFLPMMTTVTLAQGAVRMARARVIVKHLSSIQNLGSMDVLCSDKTGTLTSGRIALSRSMDPLGIPSDRPLRHAAVNSRLQSGIHSPLDAAIVEAASAGESGGEKTDEIPFDFERRRVTVVTRTDGRLLFVTKGAPESVVAVCTQIETASGIINLDDALRSRCLDVFHRASTEGFRVLAVAWKQVSTPAGWTARDESDLTLSGYLTFADPLSEGVAASLARLRFDGVTVKILTGDNALVTRHLCRQVGLDTDRMIEGRDIEGLDEAALGVVAEENDVFARVSPAQKHQLIRALRSRGHVVGFLGDGINDAPSLQAADVGISVAGAVDVAREASDIVLLDRSLDVLHAGITAGRRSFANVMKYLLMGTSSNFGNMFSMAAAALFLPFLPMLPTQILLNNLLYDLAQLSIPTDPVDPALVDRPRQWDIGLVRRFMVVLGPVSSLFDLLTFWVLLRGFKASPTEFRTGWFLESLATQTLVLFVIRTSDTPWKNPPGRPLVLTTLTVVAVGMLLPVSPLAERLDLAPLPLPFALYLMGATATYLTLVEFVKRHIFHRFLSPVDRSSPPRQRAQNRSVGVSR